MALAHVHTARRLHFSASSDGLLLWLSEECWGRGLIRLAELLDELLTERQAEQPEPHLDPSWRPFCPSEGGGLPPPFSELQRGQTMSSRTWAWT